MALFSQKLLVSVFALSMAGKIISLSKHWS